MLTRVFFDALATSRGIEAFASRYGLRPQNGFARRFVAGATAGDAVAVARQIEAAGLAQTLAYLAPTATTMADADTATRACLDVIKELGGADIGRTLSLNLTHFGLAVDRATCVDNLRRLLDVAAAHGFFVWIAMEDSRYTQSTFEVFETLWQQEYRDIGAAVQASLRRSTEDARRLNTLGARVRLVKGAYSEPKQIAFRSRAAVNRAFIGLMELLLSEGTLPAVATHDRALVDATKQFARTNRIPADRFEFQMLYRVRSDLQVALHAEGYRIRVHVPFGREWFPYVMRRLGEHPADMRFVLRDLLRDPWF